VKSAARRPYSIAVVLAYKLGSDLTVDPPDHLVSLLDNIIARKEQDKFIGNVEPHDIDPHAFVRNV
jgi:hypothetical protein